MLQAYVYGQTLLAEAVDYLTTPRKGQGMVEYALILVFIAVVVIIGMTALGGGLNARFENLADTVGI